MKYIEELVTYKKDIDAIQIAEILWLSQFMGSESSKVEEKPKSTSDIDDAEIEEPIEEDLPSIEDEAPEPIDKSTSIHENKKQKYGFDKEKDNGSIYTINIIQKEKFPKIEKQFQSLKVKQNRISKQLLDEIKTADYIATTGYFYPIFSEIKSTESYFSLHIIIDKSESMFLWESYTQHFIKSMKFSTIFTHIHIFELNSSQKEPSVCAINSDHSINLNSSIFREEKSITLIFSDITGNSWKSNRMFEVLDKWSKGSFVTIVSMLPKRMWKKTPLRQGISLFMKPRKFLPKNKDLKAEFDFIGTKTVKKDINIPMLTFDSYSFSHLSNILMSKKDSWVDSRIFRNLVVKEVATSKKSNISSKERVKNFFSFALPKTRELAIYCSVLPLNQEIIREVIKKRDLGTEKDVFSEFYFGGLIDKDVEATFGEYAFYEGVAKELRQYISVQEMKILLYQVSEVMSSSFDVDTKKINLLYESADGSEELNDNERALVALMIDILKDKGSFYGEKIESLSRKIETIDEVQVNSSLELVKKNIIILYKEDNLNIDLVETVKYLNKICNYIIFKTGKAPFILKEEVVNISSYEKLNPLIYKENKDSLKSILITDKAYDDNFFFKQNPKYLKLNIFSSSNWSSLTSLSKNNGLIYMIGYILALDIDETFQHDESVNCIYNYLWNKSDIDKNMREAQICKSCKQRISQNISHENKKILDDLNSILDFVGKASKHDLDIFAKGHETEASVVIQLKKNGWNSSNIIQEYKFLNRHIADVLLHYKDKDLAIIEVKSPKNKPKAGLEQAISYGKELNIDYVYATNGLEIYEYSIDEQKGNVIDEYPSPDELWERYNTPQKKLRDYPYLNNNLKRHHKEAIVTIIEEIINGNKRILLSLVTSAGKETIFLEVLHKLDKSNWYKNRKPRVLIIVNKNNTRYIERQFEVLDKKNIDFITFREISTNYNSYDIVIIEEVPRARDKVVRMDKWKELLRKSGNPIFINFTTLYQDEMKEYFGALKYSYSLDDSIFDGISRPYEVIPIDGNLNKIYFNNSQSIVKSFLDYINSKEKTLIVCKTQEEIRFISKSFYQLHIKAHIITDINDRFIMKNLNSFRYDKDDCKIAITSQNYLDIGFGNIDNIVLLTPIKSQYKLNNLLSESTRIERRTLLKGKHLQIIDFFFDEHKNYYNLKLTEKDSYELEDLESFLLKQRKKAEFEKEQREKEEKNLKAKKVWRGIHLGSSAKVHVLKQYINEIESFIHNYPESEYIAEAQYNIDIFKMKLERRISHLKSLSPVEKKLEELYEQEKNIPKSTFLFKKIQDGSFDFDKCKALKFLKQMMINEKKWKEKSNKKNKIFQRILDIVKMLEESCSEDRIEIIDDIKTINNLKKYLQENNKKEIANLIEYPLQRSGFIPNIRDKEDFIEGYNRIFDEKLINMLLRASDKDWTEVGVKGTMFKNGDIWISDGKIIAINYISEEEQSLQVKLKNEDKELLHTSLKEYQNNKLLWVSKNYRIRIDEVEDSLYRCAIWHKKRNQSRKPSLILKNGSVIYSGSGGNHYYTFIKFEYKYVINVNILGYDDSLGELLIYKNYELIEEEIVSKDSDEIKSKRSILYKSSN